MKRWLFLLAGPLIWTGHFFGVYGIASIADVLTEADDPLARMIVFAFSAACALAAALVGAAAWRAARRQGDDLDRFTVSVAGLGAAVAFVAILWQALPAAVGH
jgi:hypothetical protein